MEKRKIIFDSIRHKYTDEHGDDYISVTTILNKYSPQFDEQYWARRKAEERGVSVDTVLDEWAEIREAACEKGNRKHDFLEKSIKQIQDTEGSEIHGISEFTFDLDTHKAITSIRELEESPLKNIHPQIYRRLRQFVVDGWYIFAEIRVYHPDHLVAGTIDCLVVKGNNFYILDWKTNKDELKFKSGYYRKVNGVKTDTWVDKVEYLLYPLNNILNCKGKIYNLQLSLYAYLVEYFGYVCLGLELWHITDGEDGEDSGECIPYNMGYMYDDVEGLLRYNTKLRNDPSKTKKNKFGVF